MKSTDEARQIAYHVVCAEIYDLLAGSGAHAGENDAVGQLQIGDDQTDEVIKDLVRIHNNLMAEGSGVGSAEELGAAALTPDEFILSRWLTGQDLPGEDGEGDLIRIARMLRVLQADVKTIVDDYRGKKC